MQLTNTFCSKVGAQRRHRQFRTCRHLTASFASLPIPRRDSELDFAVFGCVIQVWVSPSCTMQGSNRLLRHVKLSTSCIARPRILCPPSMCTSGSVGTPHHFVTRFHIVIRRIAFALVLVTTQSLQDSPLVVRFTLACGSAKPEGFASFTDLSAAVYPAQRRIWVMSAIARGMPVGLFSDASPLIQQISLDHSDQANATFTAAAPGSGCRTAPWLHRLRPTLYLCSLPAHSSTIRSVLLIVTGTC
ncbi:hypothetical protein BCR44DRAFT_177983 [Catenaria anguillulae PL171]|uniref:Uncharacterized protein n=1 Tax=Catenaria anguillulae PL171 TaxID=765915 RepID=A0A1Y2H7E0_9FUNG|nr:hypothetical protein BCR44DRAFT_177983 [Catenaria anguillulae PL171]